MKRRGTLTRRQPGRKPQGATALSRALPRQWLFTDAARLPDPLPLLARLPPGSGVILRHYGHPQREAIAAAALRIARSRGLVLLLAGEKRAALRLGADGAHLPEVLLRAGGRGRGVVTAAAHGPAAIIAAARAGVAGVFISPVFATASHPGASGLGLLRFAALLRLARRHGLQVFALGGIDAAGWRRLAPLQPDGSGGIGRYI